MPKKITCWCIDHHDLLLDHDCLSHEEVKRKNQFIFEKDQLIYANTRVVLRKLLSYHTGIAPHRLIFDYKAYGKPCLNSDQNSKNIHFNISHSQSLSMIAISPGNEIGIDIEYMQPIKNMMQIAKDYFSNQEYSHLKMHVTNQRNTLFYQYWTLKEAYLKLTGEGIAQGLKTAHFTISPSLQLVHNAQHSLTMPSQIIQKTIHEKYMFSCITFSKNTTNLMVNQLNLCDEFMSAS